MEAERPPLCTKQEKRFLLAVVAALAATVALAFCFAAPLRPAGPDGEAAPAPLLDAVRVDLNTAGAEALCTLPGVGESRAQAILSYRAAHGPFAQLSDLLAVPGITQATLDSWAGIAFVS